MKSHFIEVYCAKLHLSFLCLASYLDTIDAQLDTKGRKMVAKTYVNMAFSGEIDSQFRELRTLLRDYLGSRVTFDALAQLLIDFAATDDERFDEFLAFATASKAKLRGGKRASQYNELLGGRAAKKEAPVKTPMNTEQTTTSSMIPVESRSINGEMIQSGNARDLHTALGVKEEFGHWAKRYNAKFVENQDFVVFVVHDRNSKGGRPRVDYYWSLDMGKHVAMMSETDKSHVIRQYFIDVEKRQHVALNPKTPAEALVAMSQLMVDFERRLRALESK